MMTTRRELARAQQRASLIDFDVHDVREGCIFCEDRPPARFGKRAAEPETGRSQLAIRLATIQRTVVQADHQRRAFGEFLIAYRTHEFCLYS